MRDLPTITIVIPTFNSANHIVECLASCKDQEYPGLEVEIIDGGSTDHTVQLANSFNGLKVACVAEPDKGIYDACNKGIAKAKGDLVLVLGSDDRLVPRVLHKVGEAWKAQPVDIIAGKAFLVSKSGGQLRVDEPYGVGALASGIPFCHNAMFVTPQTYKKVGSYDLRYRICADAHWVHRAIKARCTFQAINDVIVEFADSGVSSTNAERLMEETYAVVMENFPCLSRPQAETVFKSVRGWIAANEVAPVLKAHSHEREFIESVTQAMGSRLPMTEIRQSKSVINKLLEKFAGLIK